MVRQSLIACGLVLAIPALTSCATVPAPPPPCVVVTYSPEFQSAVADEIRASGDRIPHVVDMLIDYGRLRAACRT